MKDARALALIGAALLFVGVFLPLISLPIVGSMNYIQNGRGDGVIVLVMAGIAAILALTGRTSYAIWPGLGSLAVLAFTFIQLQTRLSDMRETMNAELAGNPFAGLAQMAMQSVQIQWGWAVLMLGGMLVTYSGWKARSDTAGNEG